MTHILKCFVDKATLEGRLNDPNINSFKTLVEAYQSLLPSDYATKPLDVFLQYQWVIKGDNDKTYLELPKNMKDGYWICPAQVGNFTEKREDGLTYVNEQGINHPFERKAYFLESPKAYQQTEGENSSTAGSQLEAPAQAGAQPSAAADW